MFTWPAYRRMTAVLAITDSVTPNDWPMALNLRNARNAKRNFVSRSALLASWVRLKRAAPYGAASPGLTGSHMFVMFLTLSNKTAHFQPSGRDGKKGQQPRNDASLSKYSHRYNEGCGARFMCLIKWTNIVSRLRRGKKINRLWDFSCAIGGIVFPAQRISRARRKRARCAGSLRS